MLPAIACGSPDLICMIPPMPESIPQGATFSGSVTLLNVGTSSAPGIADIFINYDSPGYKEGDRIERFSYPGLDGMDSFEFPFSYTFSDNSPTGTYYLTSKVDVTNTSDETDEENNERKSSIMLSPSTDLIISSISTVEDGRVVLEWSSSSNQYYEVQQANTIQGEFTTISSNLPATTPRNYFTNSIDQAQSFYRINARTKE